MPHFLMSSQPMPEPHSGQITPAEANLCSLTQPIAPRTWVNTPLALYSDVEDLQFVLLQQTFHQAKCPCIAACAQLPDFQFPCTGVQALWKQQAWVADDDMDYYLTVLCAIGEACSFEPATFPSRH